MLNSQRVAVSGRKDTRRGRHLVIDHWDSVIMSKASGR